MVNKRVGEPFLTSVALITAAKAVMDGYMDLTVHTGIQCSSREQIEAFLESTTETALTGVKLWKVCINAVQ